MSAPVTAVSVAQAPANDQGAALVNLLPSNSPRQLADAALRVVKVCGLAALVVGACFGLLMPRIEDFGVVVGVAVGAGCAVWAVGHASSRALAWWWSARRRTASVVGTVSGRRTAQAPSDLRYVYQRVLQVSYRDGARLRELDWPPSSAYTSNGSWLERVDRRYPDGKQLQVYYEPQHPENAGVGRARSAPFVATLVLLVYVSLTLGTSFFVASSLSALWSAP